VSARGSILKASNLKRIVDPDFFFWAVGIEDTFITAPWPATGRTLDEYELTDHYRQWRADLDLMGELGISHARYGIPWHRINPTANTWDWSFADQSLEYLLELGIQPIVDLVHYGLPAWIEGAYLNPAFPSYMAEYARRAAERFQGRIFLWTPLNEPRITAWYCGKLGWWPPFQRGWRGFLQVMFGVCRGIVETSKTLKAVDGENVIVHVDATDLYETADASLLPEVEQRREIVFLALDLISGKLTPEHRLVPWLMRHGLAERDLAWFQENALKLEIIGLNLYPLFSRKILQRAPGLRVRMPYASGEIVEQLSQLYFDRYRVLIFISETASLGSVRRRAAWLRDSVAAVRRARASGIPIVGYTWWPLFALVTWAYRQGIHPPAYYLKQMGLWNLAATPEGGLARVRTSLVDEFKELAENGPTAAGILAAAEPMEGI
jgi:beta-glucosidase